MAKKKKYTGENYPWTNYMTLEEWKLFASNYNLSERTIKEHLYNCDESFIHLIYGAFVFALTPQGHDFWLNIAERTEPIVKKITIKAGF